MCLPYLEQRTNNKPTPLSQQEVSMSRSFFPTATATAITPAPATPPATTTTSTLPSDNKMAKFLIEEREFRHFATCTGNFSNYLVRRDGLIYSVSSDRVMSQQTIKGHLMLSLYNDEGHKKNLTVSRVILAAYEPDWDETMEANHMNHDTSDNRWPENIEGATTADQTAHREANSMNHKPKPKRNEIAPLPQGVKEVMSLIDGYTHLMIRSNNTMYNANNGLQVYGSPDEDNKYIRVQGTDSTSTGFHRLVAAALVPNSNPGKFNVVNHIKVSPRGEPLDNSAENLEWTSHSGNAWSSHHAETGGHKVNKEAGRVNLGTSRQVHQLRKDGSIINTFPSAQAAADSLEQNAEKAKLLADTIRRVCSDKYTQQATGGYGWKYSEAVIGPISVWNGKPGQSAKGMANKVVRK